MELVHEIPITEFCQERGYGLRSRLALFRKVCLAVHHGHQKGIIHHRLSPANVIVTMDGEQPVPEVIAFGIATGSLGKLTGPNLLQLERSAPPLDNPVYLSPEQATSPEAKLDARTDVYSLGVLLYELLAGQPPFNPNVLLAVGDRRRRRIIRKVVPPSPSTRLLQALSPSGPSNPCSSRIHLQSVRGELDRIVMKAIDKDRARRYQTAKAFSADLWQYLSDATVHAHARRAAPSYRKPSRHRKAACAMALTIALALAAIDATHRWEARLATRISQDSDEARLKAEFAYAAIRPERTRAAPARPQAEHSYEGPLDRAAHRGVKTVSFKVPGGRPDEICVIPQHLPFAKYRGKGGAKDRAAEHELARYDYYKTGPAESGVIGLSPKRTSTSAAVNLYALPAGTIRPERLTASYCRRVEKTGKRVAKFKQTDNKFTTTSTASILGYYHVSRALGDICEIKPAVLRTMDIQQHKKVVRLATEMGARGTVAKSWALFNKYYANPKRSAVARDLFTSDFTQIYGALLENTTGEEYYSEWLKVGTNLSRARAFRHMADSRPAASILGSRAFTQRNVQELVAMRDMSELILLDYLLAQSDRLSGGNISAYDFAYYLDSGEVKSSKASKATDLPRGAPRVIVKKLTITDTDAGMLNSNVFERKGYLERIRHMHPRTYACLQTFARRWESDPAVRAFFHRECTFNRSQLARFEKYLLKAARTLHRSHANGSLRLDLDLDDYFQGTDPYPVVPHIAASVGRWERGAANRPADVQAVQRLLTTAAQALRRRELDPRGVDGQIAHPPRRSTTVTAIEAFEQICQLGGHGVIEPGSQTWQMLRTAAGERPAQGGGKQPLAWHPSLAKKNANH